MPVALVSNRVVADSSRRLSSSSSSSPSSSRVRANVAGRREKNRKETFRIFSSNPNSNNFDDNDNNNNNNNKDKPLDAFFLGKALAETVLERFATETVSFISDATNLPKKIEDELEQLKSEVEKRAKEESERS